MPLRIFVPVHPPQKLSIIGVGHGQTAMSLPRVREVVDHAGQHSHPPVDESFGFLPASGRQDQAARPGPQSVHQTKLVIEPARLTADKRFQQLDRLPRRFLEMRHVSQPFVDQTDLQIGHRGIVLQRRIGLPLRKKGLVKLPAPPPAANAGPHPYAGYQPARRRWPSSGRPRAGLARNASPLRCTPLQRRPSRPATLLFFAVLLLVFQAVFTWATPMMDGIDTLSSGLGRLIIANMGENALSSFLADGVIAGVGSVIIFLPQILILFLFIIILEDTGYLARTSFLMDRVMRTVGLSGQSVIPMLSSFACAVPSIMATRVIPDRRDRIATIMAAPFMTCSARLPIYALLIAAFVPNQYIGWMNLQGLVLFGLYLLGILGGLGTALLLKSSALKGPKPHFMLALPEFRAPNIQTVSIKLFDRGRIFLKRAGTVIFVVAILVWTLAYFPRMDTTEFPTITATNDASDQTSIANARSAAQMEQSWLGRMGRTIEPVFKPLGWDWRVSSAVIAGFPAREVVVAVMGTIYAVGSDADEQSLSEKLRSAKWPDGRLIFTLPMVLGLLVFYAWCLQCAATLATIRRETNSWRWPIFAWIYMTSIGYTGALIIYQVGSLL